MKQVRSALALALSISMALLAPGGTAWSQVAQVTAAVAPASAGSAASAGAMRSGSISAPVALAPALSLTNMAPAFTAPSAFAPAAASPLTSAASAAAPAALAAASVSIPASRAAAEVPAAAAPASVLSMPSAQALKAAPAAASVPARAPTARGQIERAAAPLAKPGADAAQHLSAVFDDTAKAPAFDDVLPAQAAAADGPAGAAASPLARYRASPSNSPAVAAVERSPAARTARAAAAPLMATAAGLTVTAASGFAFAAPILTLPLVFISLILHEIGHAKAAKWLGDPTATDEGRASFNPATWGRHVDPIMTVVMPLVTYLTSGFIFGGAKPVPVDTSYFKHPSRDMAIVAVAGPAVNVALAALGALAYAGAVAAGLGPIVLAALTSFVFINAVLAIFNLMPIPPLDGGHVLLAALPSRAADAVRGAYAKLGMLGMIPILLIAFAGGGVIMAAAAGLTHLLIGFSIAATGAQLASAALPAIAAMGMAIGSLKTPAGVGQLAAAAPPSGPVVPGEAAAGGAGRPVDLVVMFAPRRSISKDLHLTSADSRSVNYVQAYEGLQRGLLAELTSVGVSPETLASYNASPIASYRRINAATIRVDASKAAEFEAALTAAGHKVYPNDRRRIVIPRPILPEDADPTSRNPIGMAENLKITKADAVQAILTKRFGAPDMNPWQKALRAVSRALGAQEAPQPLIGVVDSGADTTHPLLKRVKEVKNETAGQNIDDIGHGSWVTSMVLNYAPWLKNVTHYKTFEGGGANLDDILKSLTAAANDGNLVISNSWGSDDGDPQSPDSVLVQKLASEGHVLVFAAGNAGPGANTIGSPAIVQYKDATTGAIRVVAVAATDRNKKIASFSSRGPGSPKTVGQTGLAERPNLSALGFNTEGAWPAALGDADRTDPTLGAIKAISGTSMSTPSVAGALALLLIAFGVTAKGDKLDAVVNAVMSTLVKTGQSADAEGEGFINVEAAYETLYKQFNPGGVPPTAIARYRQLKSNLRINDDFLKNAGDGSVLGGNPSMPLLNAGTVDRISNEMIGDRRAMEALAAEYPGVERASAGLFVRAWARLKTFLTVSEDVKTFRRLAAKIQDNEYAEQRFLAEVATLDAGTREEMLEHYERYIEPVYRIDTDAFSAFVQKHPGVEYRSAGPIGRLILRLQGRMPVPAYVTKYRALSAKIRDNDARRQSYMDHLTGGPGVREELLETYYRDVAPEYDADEAALVELVKQHPNAEYEASGPFTRLFLRLTGRGPKS
jgi:Zn-dependent protease